MLTRAEAGTAERDPALAPFLGLLARAMQRHPERLSAVPPEFARRLLALAEEGELDLEAPLDPSDD
ncbi:MAG: hypothetical protein RL244_2622 [Pseudomonadota bacterium]|jgi:hypothetical protein